MYTKNQFTLFISFIFYFNNMIHPPDNITIFTQPTYLFQNCVNPFISAWSEYLHEPFNINITKKELTFTKTIRSIFAAQNGT